LEEALGNSKSKVHEKRATASEVCDAGKIFACQWRNARQHVVSSLLPCTWKRVPSTTDSEVWTWKSISSCGCRRSNSATVRFRPSLCYLPHPQIQPHSLQHHRLFSRRTNKCPTTRFWCSTQPFPWLLNHHRDGHTQPSHGHGSSAASQAFRFRAARSEEVVAVVVDTS
jgi:hypothetical protein